MRSSPELQVIICNEDVGAGWASSAPKANLTRSSGKINPVSSSCCCDAHYFSCCLSMVATGMSNANIMGVTVFALAAPDCLEDIFGAIAKLLSLASSSVTAEDLTATAKATTFPHPVRPDDVYMAREQPDAVLFIVEMSHQYLNVWG